MLVHIAHVSTKKASHTIPMIVLSRYLPKQVLRLGETHTVQHMACPNPIPLVD